VSEAPVAAEAAAVVPAGAYTARREGQTIAVMGIAADGISIEATVYPRGKPGPIAAGPYRFATPAEAKAFLEEAFEALTYLGCEIS
jgi:hypothetical protein